MIPFQKVHHYKAVLNNSFVINDGYLKLILGWQQNRRQEFADILSPDEYGLYFLLNTINYDVRYILPEKTNLNISFGITGMYQQSKNKGIEFLVPEYNLFDIGGFIIAKKSIDKLDISGGIRYDSRMEKGDPLFLNGDGEKVDYEPGAVVQFKKFNTQFTGISGSIGAAYQFSEILFSKVNISRGFRAPNIAEVGANGVHEGTIRYEIGDPKLKAETSLQFDYALGLNSEHLTAEIDLFSNNINNFIFPGKLSSTDGGDSLTDDIQTFKYISADATLFGGEASIDIHPHPYDWLHFENSFAYVQSTQKNQPDSTKYLPFTPAPKYSSELKATSKKLTRYLKNAYIQFGADIYFKQDKFYAANGTETATPGYTLFNAGIGSDVSSKDKTLFSVYISVSNLTDIVYQSHLSRLKYGAENFTSGRTGVYNMGRNVSIKIVVPLDLKKPKRK